MDSIREQIERCIRLSLKGENQRALEEIDKIIKAGSGGEEGDPAYAYFAKGNILKRLGRHDESLSALRTAATLEHNNDSILFNLGMGEVGAGNTRRGREYLERAAQLGHKKAKQAIEALDKGDVVVSSESEKEALEFIGVHIRRGMANVENRRYEDAIVEYNQAIEMTPGFGHTYTLRGVAYGELEKYDQALKDHCRAIELDPNNAVAYYNRGVIHEKMNQAEKAVRDYTTSIGLDSSDADVFYNRGTMYNAMQRFGESIPDFTRAIELNPKYAMAYNNRGNAQMWFGRYDSALDDFSSAIKIDPGEAMFYINKGLCYIYLGDSQKANTQFQKAVQQDPQRALHLIQQVEQQLKSAQQ